MQQQASGLEYSETCMQEDQTTWEPKYTESNQSPEHAVYNNPSHLQAFLTLNYQSTIKHFYMPAILYQRGFYSRPEHPDAISGVLASAGYYC